MELNYTICAQQNDFTGIVAIAIILVSALLMWVSWHYLKVFYNIWKINKYGKAEQERQAEKTEVSKRWKDLN